MNKGLIKEIALLSVTLLTVLTCNNAIAANTTKKNQYSDHNANWLAGSWGITHRLNGGYILDNAVDSSDWRLGADEIIENLPSAGHVITSLTHPARAHLFTLRDNTRINVAARIHPDMVPSRQNEEIIFDVIEKYRSAGKKVILYINTASPSMIEDSFPENELAIRQAWEDYYNSDKWKGDEAAAWRDLILGYIERFDGLADGYWLDNVRKLPGSEAEFVEMIRSVDPTVAITVNKTKEYFTDENGDFLYVDSDGFDDLDDTDYKIIKYAATNELEDFTSGHITPLGQGAPPNSWGYEEYTIPDMQNAPWDNYEGKKDVLKHAWFPIRETWSTGTDMVFNIEQAYRFTRKITDAGAGLTWSTTEKDGHLRGQDMEMMLEIENRMSQKKPQDYEVYERPSGAYLLKN